VTFNACISPFSEGRWDLFLTQIMFIDPLDPAGDDNPTATLAPALLEAVKALTASTAV
jgi:hypothetical protein